MMEFDNTIEFARRQDEADPLKNFRSRFYLPKRDGRRSIYFSGHSLGLQPKTARAAIQAELDDWANLGVDGHFRADNPWYSYHEILTPPMARLVGSRESEVVCMGSLTTNLHLLFVSFYRPAGKRCRIISEGGMFPSDRYMLETQARFHGHDPEDVIVEVRPRDGDLAIRDDDILDAIAEHGDELAMVFLGGVNYFTGQLFDIRRIADAAHAVGALAGFDLAHAVGNVPLSLSDWGVDFAAWCSYKYLNAGPGNVAAIFVNDRHGKGLDLPRFGGWWGHDKERRFLMESGFSPMPGAEGWQISNAPIVGMSVLRASLDIFEEAGIDRLRQKSVILTGFLEYVIDEVIDEFPGVELELITPRKREQRGSQLSLNILGADRTLFDDMTESGIVGDFREPSMIRLAPVPLYNTFAEVHAFGEKLRNILARRGG